MNLLKQTQIFLGVIFSAALFLTGCGGTGIEVGPTVEISGKVTLDGEPVKNGTVHFANSERGKVGYGKLNTQGSYKFELKDTNAGETYAVYIGGVDPEPGAETPEGHPAPDIPPDVPQKFQLATTSDLTAKIAAEGTQTFNFELKSK